MTRAAGRLPKAAALTMLVAAAVGAALAAKRMTMKRMTMKRMTINGRIA